MDNTNTRDPYELTDAEVARAKDIAAQTGQDKAEVAEVLYTAKLQAATERGEDPGFVV